MSHQESPASSERHAQFFDLQDYVDVIRKRKYVILATLLLSVIGTSIYVLKKTPIYVATASIVIEPLMPNVLNNVEDVTPLSSNIGNIRDFYETEYKILQSRTVLMKVAHKLGLDRNLSFLGLTKMAQSASPEKLDQAIQNAKPDEILTTQLLVSPVKTSKMVLIQYKDTDPIRAAELANTHARTYVEYNLERHLETSTTASHWLSEQLGDLKVKLENSELALFDFKKKNNILAQTLEDKNTGLQQIISSYTEKLQSVKARRIELESKRDEMVRVKGMPNGEDVFPEVFKSDSTANLKSINVDLSNQLAMLEVKFGDKHPKIVEVKEQQANVQKRMHQELDSAMAALDAELRITSENERKFKEALRKASAEALDLNKNLINYKRLIRENENNNRLYGLVMGRLKDTDLTSLIKSSNVRIIDSAQVPIDPAYPQKLLDVLIAVGAGLLVGLILAVVLDFADNTIKTQDDVEHVLGLTFLGFIPDMRKSEMLGPDRSKSQPSKPGELIPHSQSASGSGRAKKKGKQRQQEIKNFDLYVQERPYSQVAECARAIRTNIMFMGADGSLRKILVTSAKPSEGKTSNAVNLAVVFALSGSRTLLVDTDMRKPRLHRVFGHGSDLGMTNFLLGEKSIDDVIRPTDVEGLDLLPCGPHPPAPAELLHTEKFKAMVKLLENRYDRIIFDSPPLAAVADAAVLSDHCDGVVIVVRTGQTPKPIVRSAVAHLTAANARILGVIMNSVDIYSKIYNYGYTYYYGQYGKPYGDQSNVVTPPLEGT